MQGLKRATRTGNTGRIAILVAVAMGSAWLPNAGAQYPMRPVRMISPFPPGGGTDIVARQTAQGLSARLGQPVVVESTPGASGTIATMAAVRATPDGHTILFGVPSIITIAENFTKMPDYNPARDLAPIAPVASYFTLITVNAKSPANTLAEFITMAKAHPKKYFYSTTGNGHAFHMLTELFSRQAGIELTHVPYKGNGPAQTALITGEVQLMVASSGTAKAHVQAGRLRALATLQSTQLDSFPGVPTLAESGLANMNIVNWFGVFTPIKTPRNIQSRLEQDILAMQKDAAFTEKVKALDFGLVSMGTQDFLKLLEGERNSWRDIIQAAGIKADM